MSSSRRHQSALFLSLASIMLLGCPGDERGRRDSRAAPSEGVLQPDDPKPKDQAGKDTSANRADKPQELPSDKQRPGVDPDAKPTQKGCKGIDFLVVIDNSGSMKDEQENLIASFPGFLKTIRGAVQANQSSFNILVTDTDADGCESTCKANPHGYCHSQRKHCSEVDLSEPRSCDATLGAGRRTNGKGEDCGLPAGRRFLASNDSDEAEAFRCLGNQGTRGSGNERIMGATLSAISQGLLSKGGCNEGFLRKDAILVVLFVTDEEDGGPNKRRGRRGSDGEPAQWHQKLIEAKGGDKKGVVVVGLYGDIGKKDAICEEMRSGGIVGAQESPRLSEFVGLFGKHGRSGSVCSADYNPFLQDIVPLISNSCDDFEPPPA